MIKPHKIFLFGLAVFCICFLLFICLPKEGIQIGTFKIRIPQFSIQDSSQQQKYKDISKIIALGSIIDQVSDSVKLDSTVELNNKVNLTYKTIIKISADSLKKVFHPLEYAKGEDTLLFTFFNELTTSKEKPIRILHYGDSQIEGDRITSYLRNQLQSKFGGEGIGLIPIVAINPNAISFAYDISSNWERFSPLHNTGNTNRYGVLLNYACIQTDNKLTSKMKGSEAWINLKHANIGYSLARQFKQCQVFYGFNNSPMVVELKRGSETIDADIVPVANRLSRLKWDIDSPLKDITISIKTSQTPEVYAISLDGLTGVSVDNIPLRGSSGLEFTKSDAPLLKKFYNMLNVHLLIMQFGVNVVPNIRSNYNYYRDGFYRQLMFLKGLRKNMPIIVFGVNDVSRNGTNGLESYPNIELIRNAQKEAAFNAGCAFWDVYEAMGGKNSMPSWVSANPPLAQKDFIHFTPVGAKIIAEMFYRTLMAEYERFKNLQNKTLVLTADE